jgi:hypothetical protein
MRLAPLYANSKGVKVTKTRHLDGRVFTNTDGTCYVQQVRTSDRKTVSINVWQWVRAAEILYKQKIIKQYGRQNVSEIFRNICGLCQDAVSS